MRYVCVWHLGCRLVSLLKGIARKETKEHTCSWASATQVLCSSHHLLCGPCRDLSMQLPALYLQAQDRRRLKHTAHSAAPGSRVRKGTVWPR